MAMKDWKRDRFQILSVFSGATFDAAGALILKKSRNEAIFNEYYDSLTFPNHATLCL